MTGTALEINKKGWAYQIDRTPQNLHANYFRYCMIKYKDKQKNDLINRGRIEFIEKFIGDDEVLDIGIGNGSFITARNKEFKITYGYDVDQGALRWLTQQKLYHDRFETFMAFSMWDVMEHLSEPSEYLDKMIDNSFLFLSLPIFNKLDDVKRSKHYRPGEHFWYFTENGLVMFMRDNGFELKGKDDFELRAGREDVYDYAFFKEKNESRNI